MVLLILIIAATFTYCCLRRIMRQREQKKSDWTKDIFVTEDILHITGATEKTAKNQALLQSVDPLEFPRNKLVFLNTILGKALQNSLHAMHTQSHDGSLVITLSVPSCLLLSSNVETKWISDLEWISCH